MPTFRHIGNVDIPAECYTALTPPVTLNLYDSLKAADVDHAAVIEVSNSQGLCAVEQGGPAGPDIQITERHDGSGKPTIKCYRGWIYIWGYVPPIESSRVCIAASGSIDPDQIKVVLDCTDEDRTLIHCISSTTNYIHLTHFAYGSEHRLTAGQSIEVFSKAFGSVSNTCLAAQTKATNYERWYGSPCLPLTKMSGKSSPSRKGRRRK